MWLKIAISFPATNFHELPPVPVDSKVLTTCVIKVRIPFGG